MSSLCARPSAADLHKYFSERVFRLFRSYGHSAQESEDLKQEVFLRVHKGLATYRGEGMAAWILTIARHVHQEALRTRSTRRRSHRSVALEEACDVPIEASQQREVEATERGHRLKGQIRDLPRNEARCVWLYYFHGYTYREIAELMRASTNQVREWLRNARKRLKKAEGGGGSDV